MVGQKYYWLYVTSDEYELPLAVADSAGQLALMIGVPLVNIATMASKYENGLIKKSKYVKVKVEEGEDE